MISDIKQRLSHPITIIPMEYRFVFQSKMLTPLHDGFGVLTYRHASIAPTIIRLILITSPNAVFWRIRTIVVFSFKGIVFWTSAHICQKIIKRIFPPITHNNASLTITKKRRVFGIVTTTQHCLPNLMFRYITTRSFPSDLSLAVARLRAIFPFVRWRSLEKRTAYRTSVINHRWEQ